VILFIPVAMDFNGVAAAGSGAITRWTYTVPAGKRAILTHVFCEVIDNANAVNTTFGDIFCTIGAVSITAARVYNDAAGNNTLTPNIAVPVQIDLQAGNTVNGRTFNVGAAGVAMVVRAVIREYQ
jgi:hypothetical protein